MDRRRALEPMEQFEGLGFMTATALLFRTFIHDVTRKPEHWPQATVRVWGVLLR
jgi:autonomous glycyl radical cofactor GrcA